MKNILVKIMAICLLLGLSCGKQKEDKHALLNKYKAEYKALEKKILKLEKELGKTKPTTKDEVKAYPVSTIKVSKTTFSNYVDFPGLVTSKQNVQVFAEISGNVKRIYVKEGQYVRKGQLIAKQDASTVITQLGQLKSNLKLATTTFERQQRLWEQKIGSEMQYLQAKTNKETLEEQIKAINAQITKYSIYSPINGVVDELFINQGEMAMGRPVARIINLKNVRIEAQLSEKYIGKVKKNDLVTIIVSSLNLKLTSRISAIGQIVNPTSRTFRVESVFTNPQRKLKPNMSAIMRIRINKIENIITIPFNVVQKKGNKNYVFVAKKLNDKEIAVKKHILIEDIYQGTAAVKEGLAENDLLIVEGHAKLQDSLLVANIIQ